jgi:hypothetical protein
MHALLATNIDNDILFIQEPWFSTVGMARCDSAINGKDVLGGAASPKWTLAYCYGRSTVVSDLDGWGFVLNVRWRKLARGWTISKSVQRSDG